MPNPAPDLTREEMRIAVAYARRKLEGKSQLYTWHQQSVMFERYRLRAMAAAMLYRHGWRDLAELEALDVGCGAGGWLRTLMEWGISPQKLHGIDLLEDRVAYAQSLAPQLDLRRSSGWEIPFPDASMDLVSAHTVFSSILDLAARWLLAQEMARVAKPGGAVMVYDFRIADPRNPDTVGISPAEIRQLFPDCTLQLRSLTIPPPISRRISPALTSLLESLLPFIRTHRLYLLRK